MMAVAVSKALLPQLQVSGCCAGLPSPRKARAGPLSVPISRPRLSPRKTSREGAELSLLRTAAPPQALAKSKIAQVAVKEPLLQQLDGFADLASDCSELHRILDDQRNNWTRLCDSDITMASAASAFVSTMDAATQALHLPVVATVVGVGGAALMSLVYKLHQSQERRATGGGPLASTPQAGSASEQSDFDIRRAVNQLNKLLALTSTLFAAGGELGSVADAFSDGKISGAEAMMGLSVGAFFACRVAHAIQTYRRNSDPVEPSLGITRVSKEGEAAEVVSE